MSTTASAHRRRLRILALVTDAFGAGGGIAQYNRDLLGALDATDSVEEIVVLPRSGSPTPGSLPGKVRLLEPRIGKLAWAWATVRAAWTGRPFDVVFCGHLFSAPVAALAARIVRAPLWLQLHGIEAWDRPRPLLRIAAEQAWQVTAVSRFTRRKFLAWANCSPESVKVLPNTVEERFSPGPRNPSLQHRYDLAGKQVLLTVSRLATSERYKGHDLVMQALALLRPKWPDLVYVIAGDGDDRSRLQALAARLGVAESTRFVGYVDESDLPDLYRSADVFVMPSTGEGFGIVFLQAQACGIPAISGGCDGSSDPLRDGLGGHVLTSHTPDELARTIDALLTAGPANAVNGTNADVFARAHFHNVVDRIVQRMLAQRPLASAAR